MSEAGQAHAGDGRQATRVAADFPILRKPEPPLNLYKPGAPFTARVLFNKKISQPGTEDDIRHVVVDTAGSGYHFIEGQSMGVIAPGQRAPGKPHQVRLYSIASGRDGALVDGTPHPGTVALCVKRVAYRDETGQEQHGVCSNYICDLAPGDAVQVTGPSGKAFVLPEDPTADLILFATGTGIAPFRGFFQRLFETAPEPYTGHVLLFYGAKTRRELVYLNEADDSLAHFQSQFHVEIFTALSRENPGQPKVYVQHRLAEQKAAAGRLLDRGNFAIYICGLKGMDQAIEDVFAELFAQRGQDWADVRAVLKKTGRYNVEVY